MNENPVIVIVSAVLGGGLISGIAAIYKARQESKKIPKDLDSISIGSAERALVMLKTMLDEAEERINELKRERDEERERHRLESLDKDRRISQLEEELRVFFMQFQEVQQQLARVLRTAQEAKNDNGT